MKAQKKLLKRVFMEAYDSAASIIDPQHHKLTERSAEKKKGEEKKEKNEEGEKKEKKTPPKKEIKDFKCPGQVWKEESEPCVNGPKAAEYVGIRCNGTIINVCKDCQKKRNSENRKKPKKAKTEEGGIKKEKEEAEDEADEE